MVPNIIETANATDFITSPGIHRLFAPKIIYFACPSKIDSICSPSKLQWFEYKSR